MCVGPDEQHTKLPVRRRLFMKIMMFAALAAAVAMPALAQTTPAPATPDTSMSQPQQQPAPGQPAPAADPAMAQPAPAQAAPAAPAAAAPMAATGDYPPCSRTVKDGCTERSNAAGARVHGKRTHKR
jgi:predicted lipid-binding transport protein (Tim44 family)